MSDECLVCRAPLEYLESDEMMECSICGRQERSKTRCVNGHYVCNECHVEGMDSIVSLCLNERSKNPVEILDEMMALPFCHMHGPEHHLTYSPIPKGRGFWYQQTSHPYECLTGSPPMVDAPTNVLSADSTPARY